MLFFGIMVFVVFGFGVVVVIIMVGFGMVWLRWWVF